MSAFTEVMSAFATPMSAVPLGADMRTGQITISGLTIKGGFAGIGVVRSGSAQIRFNTVTLAA